MITNISLIDISVKDIDESHTFYTDVLGFEEHNDIPLADGPTAGDDDAPQPARDRRCT